jgi:hypothetical protein
MLLLFFNWRVPILFCYICDYTCRFLGTFHVVVCATEMEIWCSLPMIGTLHSCLFI